MSATTTTRTQTTAPLAILADYEVHHSGRDQTAPANSDRSPTSTNQPPGWPTDRHRVPTYRPINRDLDQSERPAGSNTLEFGIIIVMLHGVWLNAVCFLFV